MKFRESRAYLTLVGVWFASLLCGGAALAAMGVSEPAGDITKISRCGKNMPIFGTDNCESEPSSLRKKESSAVQTLETPQKASPKTTSKVRNVPVLAKPRLVRSPIPCKDEVRPIDENSPRFQCDASLDPNQPGYKTYEVMTKQEAVLRSMRPSLVVIDGWADAILFEGTSDADKRRSMPSD